MHSYLVDDIFLYCDISRKGTIKLPSEKIKFYDLTIVLSGELTYIINGEQYVLKKNDLLFVPPASLRERHEAKDNVHYISFNFSLLPTVELSLPTYMSNGASSDIKKMLAIYAQKHISPYHNSKMKLINILNYILLDLVDSITLETVNEHVIKILKYIDAHITERLSLQSISHEIGLSKEYTASIFKKEMGCTVTHYINDKKMTLAKQLISHNEMTLVEISAYLGYDNYSYFSRLFKRYLSISPQTYMSKNKHTPNFN